MKTVTVYGVEMTPAQEMIFSKYISLNNIAPNTLTVEERKQLVLNWLNNKPTKP